jgi:Trypsin-like peptidase domain
MIDHRRRIVWVVAVAAALTLTGNGRAGAHTHPTPTERSAPGVVWVEARATVEVALVEHLQADPSGVHIAIVQSTSSPLLAAASGFAVDPNGAVVTSGSITQNDLDRAAIYGVNQAFRSRYGDMAPLTGDPFTRQHVGPDASLLEQRLQACYPPYRTNDAGGCHVMVTPTYVVYPYVTSQEKYGRLAAELLPGATKDLAVLQARGANSMPTVALGESTAGARALSALGFTGVPGEQQLQTIDTHLDKVGGTVLKTQGLAADEAKANARLAASLPSGMRGGPLVAEGGQVIGFLEPGASSGPPSAAPGRLVDVRAIRAALSAEGITPRRGPVDTSFEAASHPFKNGGYAAALPSLKATLALFPGHFMAAKNLAVAEQMVASGKPGPAGSAAARSTATGNSAGLPWGVVLLVVVAVLLLAGVALLLLRRRRRTSDAGEVIPSAETAPPPGGRGAVLPRPRSGRREPTVTPGSREGRP